MKLIEKIAESVHNAWWNEKKNRVFIVQKTVLMLLIPMCKALLINLRKLVKNAIQICIHTMSYQKM